MKPIKIVLRRKGEGELMEGVNPTKIPYIYIYVNIPMYPFVQLL
jgi:hypothetical protein